MEKLRDKFSNLQKQRQESINQALENDRRYRVFLRDQGLSFIKSLQNIGNTESESKSFWDSIDNLIPQLKLDGNLSYERLSRVQDYNLTVDNIKRLKPPINHSLSYAAVQTYDLFREDYGLQVGIDYSVDAFGMLNWSSPQDSMETVPIMVTIGKMSVFYVPQNFTNSVTRRSIFFNRLKDIGIVGNFTSPSLRIGRTIRNEEDVYKMKLVANPAVSLTAGWLYQPLEIDLYSTRGAIDRENRYGGKYLAFITNRNLSPRPAIDFPELVTLK